VIIEEIVQDVYVNCYNTCHWLRIEGVAKPGFSRSFDLACSGVGDLAIRMLEGHPKAIPMPNLFP
jgi:hypothetical protein